MQQVVGGIGGPDRLSDLLDGNAGEVAVQDAGEFLLEVLRADEAVWRNYQAFSEPYTRIRVAYIDAARKRPEEFQKRLSNFVQKTRENKVIVGYGGIEKYYGKADVQA